MDGIATDEPGKKQPLPRMYAEVTIGKEGTNQTYGTRKSQNSEIAG